MDKEKLPNSVAAAIMQLLTWWICIGKCTCPVGFNGKHRKHQAAVLLKYNLNFSINTLTLNSNLQLYDVASVLSVIRKWIPLL